LKSANACVEEHKAAAAIKDKECFMVVCFK